MVRYISYGEMEKRIFNEAFSYMMIRTHQEILSEGCCEGKGSQNGFNHAMAKNMAKAFLQSEIGIGDKTATQTRQVLNGSNTYVKDCIDICEAVAKSKSTAAAEEGIKIPDAFQPELSTEDKNLLNMVIDEKKPTIAMDAVRNATVNALLAEKNKAEEIKAAADIAQAEGAAAGDSKKLEETVSRLSAKGPTSLMNAILTRVSTDAIQKLSESNEGSSVGELMQTYSDDIKDRAIVLYSLYEMANAFGLKKYTNADVKKLAYEIYYNQ